MHSLGVTIRGLRRWLFCALLMLGSDATLGNSYQANDESLLKFLTELSVPLGQPVVVSTAAAAKRISGSFDFSLADQTLEQVAESQGLIWYSDGQVLYLYDASEAKNSVVTLRHISVDRLRGFMRRSGLGEARYPLRESGARMFYVSGPPNYVDRVLRLAQLMDRPRAELRMGSQKIGVVQVLNTHVADRQYDMGGETITVAGLATMIEKLLADESRNASGPRSRQSKLLADKNISVMAFPDSNSLLIKGSPAQVRFIENLVAELDVPKRLVEVSLWRADLERDEFEQLGMALHDDAQTGAAQSPTRILAPLEDNALMTRIMALARRGRAKVVMLPVILTEENVPAVFQDNQTLYLSRPSEEGGQWQPVLYGSEVSVLPRFVEGNRVQMQLRIEDGRQIGKGAKGDVAAATGHVGINTVVRVPQARRLWVGGFRRDIDDAPHSAALGRYRGPLADSVRLFAIQVRAVGDDSKAAAE